MYQSVSSLFDQKNVAEFCQLTIYYQFFERKNRKLQMIVIALLLTTICAFPINKWTTSAFKVNSNMEIIDSQLEIIGNQTTSFTSFLSTDHLSFELYKTNVTNMGSIYLDSLKLDFLWPISNPVLSILNSSLIFSYRNSKGHAFSIIQKETLKITFNQTSNSPFRGVYLQKLDCFILIQQEEILSYNLQNINNSSAIRFNSGTNHSESIKYLFSQDQTLMFTFYRDKSYFLIRNLTQSSFQETFIFPRHIPLTEIGYQCACLDNDNIWLYLLLPSGKLILYNIIKSSIQMSINTNYTSIFQCYYNSFSEGIVFVNQNTLESEGETLLTLFSLQEKSEIARDNISGRYFYLNTRSTLATTFTNIEQYVYRLEPLCSEGFYYQIISQLCQKCSHFCAICTSKIQCIRCYSNYTINQNNLCQITVSVLEIPQNNINYNSKKVSALAPSATALPISPISPTTTIKNTTTTPTATTNAIVAPTTTTTNTTYTTANATAIYTNSTQNIVPTNSTLNSANTTNNFPSGTNTTSNYTNSTLNSTNATSQTNTSSIPIQNYTQTIKAQNTTNTTSLMVALAYFMNNTAITSFNSAPGSRKVFPFLCFLINIDELQLYQYHEQYYGETMEQFFEGLQILESQKWKLLGQEKEKSAYQAFGTSKQAIEASINTKSNYTYHSFYSIEGVGETFLPACWNFLTFNLIFVIVLYFLLRLIFRLLFNYRISIFLRAFSFLAYLFPLLLDGNLQYFFFLMFSQSYLGFSINPKDKFLNVAGCLLCFLILWLSMASCFLAYYFSRKLSKYVLDNWRTRVNGLLSYSLSNAARMIIFGAIHSLLRYHWQRQLQLLMVAEISYILFLCFIMKNWKTHKVVFKVWFNLIFSLLRIILQITLYVQQWIGAAFAESDLNQMFENVLGLLLNLYMFNFYVATLCEVAYEVIQLFTKKKSSKDGVEQQKIIKSKPVHQKKGIFYHKKVSNVMAAQKIVRFKQNQIIFEQKHEVKIKTAKSNKNNSCLTLRKSN